MLTRDSTSATPCTAPLPDFATSRINRFYQERFHDGWGSKNIMQGRMPGVHDVVLQSNDYLAIAGDPALRDAIVNSCKQSNSPPLMSGVFIQDSDPLRALESELACFLGYSEGILTQSGYAANVGLIQAIAGPGIPIYLDTLAHASMWEGARSAGAVPIKVHHNDIEDLRQRISLCGPGIVLVDSVYSTNGSRCDLHAYAHAAAELQCLLVVDESHSLGTHGQHGEGLVASLGLQSKVHFVTASLSKAYAWRAGFIACPPRLRLLLAMTSLPAIFSTSLLPIDVAVIRAAHVLVRAGDARRRRLWQITRRVRAELELIGYPVDTGSEQIIAFEVGTEREVMRVRDELEESGVFGSIFCPPATGLKRCLIRFSLNAGLTDAQVDHFLKICSAKWRQLQVGTWSVSQAEQVSV